MQAGTNRSAVGQAPPHPPPTLPSPFPTPFTSLHKEKGRTDEREEREKNGKVVIGEWLLKIKLKKKEQMESGRVIFKR